MGAYPSQSKKASKPLTRRPQTPYGEPASITPAQVADITWDFVKRKGFLAIPLAALLAIGCALAALTVIPPKYEATAAVFFQTPKEEDSIKFKLTQQNIILSDLVLNDALNDPKAKALDFVQSSFEPIPVLRQMIKFKDDPQSEVLNIIVSSADPDEAHILANCVLNAYTKQARLLKDDQARLLEQRLDQTVQEQTREIEAMRSAQNVLASKAGHQDPLNIRSRLTTISAERVQNQQLLQATKQELFKAQSDLEHFQTAPISLTVEQQRDIANGDEQSRKLNAELAAARLTAEELRRTSVLRDNDPQYVRAKIIIDTLEATDQKRMKDLEAIYNRGAVQKRREDIEKAKGLVRAYKQSLDSTEAQLAVLNKEDGQLQAISAEIDKLRVSMERHEEALKQTRNTLTEKKIQFMTESVQGVSPARRPESPSFDKKRFAATAGGSLFVFAACIGAVFFLDYRQAVITRVEQIKNGVDLSVLGTLPTIPAGRRLPTEEDYQPNSTTFSQWRAMQESISALRLTLSFAPDRHNDGVTSMMVTSARDGEGKSTLTALLAMNLARSGVRVVVVEADMHRPTQYETFGVRRTPGLAEVLQGTVDVAEVIQETRYPGLDVLAAGGEVADISALLTAERLTPIFAYLRRGYETILVDAPPVLAVCDAMVLGQQVEQTVLTALCHHSQLHLIQEAIERLESVNISPTGIVVGGAAARSDYGYYSSYARPVSALSAAQKPAPTPVSEEPAPFADRPTAPTLVDPDSERTEAFDPTEKVG